MRWHRQGFRLYWRWKSRGPKSGRPAIDAALRKLIREMQATNIGWGAPRIHGELLKLGIEVSQATVSKYMLHPKKPPSQAWRTFLSNHAECLAAMDFFTVPTSRFRVLYVFIVLSHDRRHVVHFNVTEHPTAQWTAQHLSRILRKYFDYYHTCRIHMSLNKDPHHLRTVEPAELGNIVALPHVGGLHHRYSRVAA